LGAEGADPTLKLKRNTRRVGKKRNNENELSGDAGHTTTYNCIVFAAKIFTT